MKVGCVDEAELGHAELVSGKVADGEAGRPVIRR
jgi:hypothetical protein